MSPLPRLLLVLLCVCTLGRLPAQAASDIVALWKERVTCTVAVEYLVETEIERRENLAYGTVLDNQGLIVLPPAAINLRYAPEQLRRFQVYVPGDLTPFDATYLGVDNLSGWHFVRAASAALPRLRPITDFIAKGDAPKINLTDEVWGIGLRGKDEDWMPYIMMSRIALINRLPMETAIAQQEITAPGLPAFNARGEFVGIGLSSFGQSFLQFSRTERGGAPVMMINLEESSALLTAPEALPLFARVPSNVLGRPIAWLGAFGLQPVDAEVSRILRIQDQGAAVVSEILEGSPAEKAGLKERDIIVALNGKSLPRFRPDRAVSTYIDQQVDALRPGDSLALTVLRNDERVTLTAVIADAPRQPREATRRYFERIGLTAREFVYDDAILRRAKASESTGLISHFVKPGSPAHSAGLLTDDWIREIDGIEVKNLDEAFSRLSLIEKDASRADFVLLVSRGGDTAVIRIKLK